MSTSAATRGEKHSGAHLFDQSLPYALARSVALRPEPFGALAYDYDSRRLSFLKTQLLVTVVRELEHHADATAALAAAGVPRVEHGRYLRALAGLCESGVIRSRTPQRAQD